MYGQPTDGGNDHDLDQKLLIYSRCVEVVPEKQDRRQVYHEGQEHGKEDLRLQFVHLRENVEELDENQGGEGDAHDVHEGVVEEDDAEQHYHCALVDRNPDPYQEGLEVQGSPFLQRLVKGRVTHHSLSVCILVEDEREDRKHGENSTVAHHQITIEDWDCDHKEDN